jgi:hypothetical protein
MKYGIYACRSGVMALVCIINAKSHADAIATANKLCPGEFFQLSFE